jgi:endonuclease III
MRKQPLPAYSPAEKRRAQAILRGLRKMYPDAHCELVFAGPFELAVAAILSAQCTDRRVNMVAPPLFAKYKTPAEWATIPPKKLEQEIHSTGFFRNKTKSILALAKVVSEQYGGVLPDDFDTLVSLPGIGRKTANVLMITAFNKPGITVDTHCKRLCKRLGFTGSDDPERIEFELRELLPRRDWAAWSHGIVFHGRYTCLARRPSCADCLIAPLCPSRQ